MATKKKKDPAVFPVIHGFKGFDADMTCRGFQFNEGETYTHDGAGGIFPNIPEQQYHSMTDYVSNSMLGRFARCPAAVHVSQDDTQALLDGRATHCYVLETEEIFFNSYAVAPDCDKRTKEGKQMFADFQAQNEGKTVISANTFAMIDEIKHSVMNHPFAAKLLADGGMSEQSVFWKDLETGLQCKCRPDRIPHGGKGVLIDLKTTTDAGGYGFSSSVRKFGYARQAAFYLDGINTAGVGAFDAFVFIAVEKSDPFRTEVYLLDAEWIEAGRQEYRRLLREYAACKAADRFPNYQNPGITTLFKPGYL